MRTRIPVQLFMAAGILLVSSIPVTVAKAHPAPDRVTLTGVVSCTTCVLPNTCRSQTRRSCVAWWVNQGAAYVLVVGTRNYRLLGADAELRHFAGNTVTVTGDAFRSDVTVSSVEGTVVRKRAEQ